MSKTIVAQFTTAPQEMPADTVPAAYRLLLVDPAGVLPALSGSCPIGASSISISNVVAGSYAASISVVDAAGNSLAAPLALADLVVVPADVVVPPAPPAPPATVTVQVPASLSITVS